MQSEMFDLSCTFIGIKKKYKNKTISNGNMTEGFSIERKKRKKNGLLLGKCGEKKVKTIVLLKRKPKDHLHDNDVLKIYFFL